jgi:ApaG protein
MVFDLSSKLTKGIRINVRSAYIKEESAPERRSFVFAYQVEIVNESRETVQLLSREWYITDGLGKQRTVTGDGVIGKQPMIPPGESYKYVSGSQFRTPIGKMEGHYLMKNLSDGSMLKVDIPAFLLVVPSIYN